MVVTTHRRKLGFSSCNFQVTIKPNIVSSGPSNNEIWTIPTAIVILY